MFMKRSGCCIPAFYLVYLKAVAQQGPVREDGMHLLLLIGAGAPKLSDISAAPYRLQHSQVRARGPLLWYQHGGGSRNHMTEYGHKGIYAFFFTIIQC